MISIENMSKAYGARELLKNISFRINKGEKVGLVGRNGHGKTTLMRILTGEEEQDEGLMNVPKNYQIGYLKQQLDFRMDNALDEAALGLPEDERDQTWRAEKILSGLGFSEADFKKHPSEFSGGYQVRLNLVKLLLSEPDLLMLDEPTNYLDITSIRWLEDFLLKWSGELILITHDRSFMDKVVTHILGIHRQKVKKIPGNTDKFYEQVATEEEIYEKTRQNEEQKRKDMEQFITRFKSKASLASRAQSRVKALERMGELEKLDDIEDLEFKFNHTPIRAKELLTAKNISFGYDKNRQLIKNFNITIGSDEKICIIGKNGRGKTTLLKLLCGIIKPDSGEVSTHSNLRAGIYEQTNVLRLDMNATIEQELINTDTVVDKQRARDVAGTMMFSGDEALKKISVLSGGEKSRVMLAKTILKPSNILFLDEPTNHLDMQSCDSLLAAIDEFKGSVVMVTHNEMFLKAFAERLIVFKNNCIEVFEGGYTEFLKKVGWDDDDSSENSAPTSSMNKKELRKLRAEVISEKNKALKPIEDEVKKLEKELEANEIKIDTLNTQLISASGEGDSDMIAKFSKELDDAKIFAETGLERLLELTDELSTKSEFYEAKLNDLG
ncbi:ABC transporter related protein [Denitrovibrio acetiphilus DSM 12809]|uniref:ABC transporter related protein n=1 Tax=Denitrovibrio acetiphilus (strain DSM 12809 / NBRC 114555 / N2460) TaxID=522772 RepID=D4H8W5_DENA2|nr:ABC-F family ATP-binding cassette domain-containing protein [Denitrovibrio acetiphilus]ADD68464.1 ABC transporter related protein [Denitrovibrio acetiphilus DSM 12809]